MKAKVFTVLVLVALAITGFVFNNLKVPSPAEVNTPAPVPQQVQTNNSWLDTFYIGAMQEDIDYNHSYVHLDSLGFNLWHQYCEGIQNSQLNRYVPIMRWKNGVPHDTLMTPVSTYAGDVNAIIDQIYSHNGGRKLIAMRPKIVWLCFGQRSDYKCNDDLDEPELWFYHFQGSGHTTGQNITDNSNFGNGVKVRYCSTSPFSTDRPGFVVSRLKANTEQCHRINSGDGNEWQGDSECDWLIKPRIRIPANFPLTNPETPVCKIKVISQDTNVVLKEVVITGRYFGNSLNPYDGSYKEDGFYFPSIDTNLTISHRDWGDKNGYCARGNRNLQQELSDTNINHADIQVYWYGNCDMWIDYVRVDNDVADQLFKGYYEQPGRNWIYDEATQIGVGKIMKYYVELVEFNNLPCMAYVNNKLHQIPNAPDLMQDLTNTISTHVPWDDRTSIENATFS